MSEETNVSESKNPQGGLQRARKDIESRIKRFNDRCGMAGMGRIGPGSSPHQATIIIPCIIESIDPVKSINQPSPEPSEFSRGFKTYLISSTHRSAHIIIACEYECVTRCKMCTSTPKEVQHRVVSPLKGCGSTLT